MICLLERTKTVENLTRSTKAKQLLSLGLFLGASLCSAGCKNVDSNGETGVSSRSPNKKNEAPDFSVGPNTKGALFTWVDEKGSFHLTESPNEIPEAARKQVRVVVDGKSVGSPEYVYVADLSEVNNDKYSLLSMPRSEWENIGKAGREQQVFALRPKEEPSAQTQLTDLQVDAIVYGADWCKPCHLAENYLKSKGARVIKKDIEEDPAAAREMQGVLKSAGLSGSSIPVLNVGGTILRGFSERAIDTALARSKKN